MSLPRVPLHTLDVLAVRTMHGASLEQLLCAVARMPTYQRTALRELMRELDRSQLLGIVPNGLDQTRGDD